MSSWPCLSPGRGYRWSCLGWGCDPPAGCSHRTSCNIVRKDKVHQDRPVKVANSPRAPLNIPPVEYDWFIVGVDSHTRDLAWGGISPVVQLYLRMRNSWVVRVWANKQLWRISGHHSSSITHRVRDLFVRVVNAARHLIMIHMINNISYEELKKTEKD